MRLVITAGGGGHFAPALAVIESLPKEWKATLIGRKHSFEGDSAISFEYKTAKERHIPFYAITTGRLQRKMTRYTLLSLLKIPFGLLQAFFLLKRLKPALVVSFGGYVAVPVVIAAALLRIPVVIHEQTLEAGLANKICSVFAKKICISFSTSRQFFPKQKTILTGNPFGKPDTVSKLINEFSEKDMKRPLLVVTGGSGGAHAINVLIEESLDELLDTYRVLHQTGDAFLYKDYGRLSVKRDMLPPEKKQRYVVTKFINPQEFPTILLQADIVIGRSGIGTITQLLHFRKPAILIPLPATQKNEQLKNARFLQEHSIAEIITQEVMSKDGLLQAIDTVIKRKNMPNKKQTSMPENSTEKIIEVLHQTIYATHKNKTS